MNRDVSMMPASWRHRKIKIERCATGFLCTNRQGANRALVTGIPLAIHKHCWVDIVTTYWENFS